MLYNILDIKCKFVYPSNENLGIISIYFFTIIKKDPVENIWYPLHLMITTKFSHENID